MINLRLLTLDFACCLLSVRLYAFLVPDVPFTFAVSVVLKSHSFPEPGSVMLLASQIYYLEKPT